MEKLSQLSLFFGTPEAECQRMVECFHAPQRSFSPGETIYTYGSGTGIGILREGSAQLIKIDAAGDRTVLERLEAGDAFGELMAFSSLPCDIVLVECQSRCTVLTVPMEKLLTPCPKGCDCHRVLLENLLTLLSRKVYALSQRIEVLSCKTIREKLLCAFRIFAAEAESMAFALPFSLSALADFLCCDRSAMMRELRRLKEEGYINAQGRRIQFLGVSGETPDICAGSKK